MTHTNLHKIVHIDDRHNKVAVVALFNALNPYGYLIGDISGEFKKTSDGVCETKLTCGADTRYTTVHTDLRTLPDKETYVHIGIELQLEKRLTFHEVFKLEKHIVLNLNNFEDNVEKAVFEMVRDLIF